ncbi:Fur-regulated basic protein FbpA [Bacillus thuringiensis]|uniref:Fur-regulated basic protein FbpA n=1 Tax=Bacillus thuringiensis TaxID=1428 RepID=A0A9W3VH11_BACTU|nr:Fur-regulated basic protein FbpA [Bacillus thuringiensis]AYF85194.1 Fur-regulated basic protein FbpA [Bacillus thuringiensis]AYF85249.1 Fur-regulated basic protein FbpA [Bacillus thuringiensis]PNK35042.1 Fur-regulated basic protein FbpA [Bacillus thuringiensis]
MDRKQIYIDVLIHKGIYKEEETGRQLYEMSEQELFKLIKGDGENETYKE